MKNYTKQISLTAALVGAWALPAMAQKSNVVVILADDQGWGDLSLVGNEMVKTPNIDHLASQGVLFDNFYVCPVSAPTRAEFLTGRYAHRTGVSGVEEGKERVNIGEKFISEHFKECGYNTAAFGKWHNGGEYPYHPNARGFDEFYGYCCGHWGLYWQPLLEHNGKTVQGEGFLSDDLTTHAIEYIEENRDNQFFLYLALNTPHSPWQVTDEWWSPWEGRELTQRATIPENEIEDGTRASLALTENIDWNVGRLLDALDKAGLDENTIVVYFSDNGPDSHRWNGEMRGTKGSSDEGGIRSNLIIRNSELIPAGEHISQLSATTDLLPTLLSLSGNKVDIKEDIDGYDLSRVITKGKRDISRSVYRTWSGNSSLHSDEYILDPQGRLYNIIDDREQLHPLEGKRYDKIRRRMLDEKSVTDAEVKEVMSKPDTRPFSFGHPDEPFSKLVAGAGRAHGGIKRSNKYPNSSYFTSWSSTEDYISWDVDVIESGWFAVEMFYACGEENLGSTVRLNCGDNHLERIVDVATPTGFVGVELDRYPRKESYLKDFKALELGKIYIDKSTKQITISAPKIAGREVVDIYQLEFVRIK